VGLAGPGGGRRRDKKIATNPGIIECLWLVRNGVPFDTAFELPDDIRAGFAIVFSQFEGAKFNFNTMTFEKPE
jgi:hypothetical protein